MSTEEKETNEKKKRGFAAMGPEKRKELAAKGGKAAQESGRGHRFTAESASVAGKKGGLAAGKAKRAKSGASNQDS